MTTAMNPLRLSRAIETFKGPLLLTTFERVHRYARRLTGAVAQLSGRIRGTDISTRMLIVGLLFALIIVLVLFLDPVARRH